LALAPEALVHPSFQMSFAATLGLVALVQIGMPRLFASPDNSATARVALWGGREIMTLALASLVAGLATTPYAAFHFHRVTPYGVVANLAAMPVVSAVVMPAGGLVALALRPDALSDGCERAALAQLPRAEVGLVVAARQAPPLCPSPVIDQDRLRR
jgi:competence protein ComEC